MKSNYMFCNLTILKTNQQNIKKNAKPFPQRSRIQKTELQVTFKIII